MPDFKEPDSRMKACKFESRQRWQENIFLLTLCADSCSLSVHTMLPQWHVKDPGNSVKSAGGRLHAYTLDPTKSEWAACAVRAYYGNPSGK